MSSQVTHNARNLSEIAHQVKSEFRPALHRFEWVDAMRGIGIFIVVFIHVLISLRDARLITAGGSPGFVIFAIHTFVMPVFMFLAGLFVQHRLRRGAIAFLRPLGATIVWPYLLWGLCILIAEWLGRGVRNQVDTSTVDITLLWTPIAWLWFLWALGIYHLIAAAIGRFPTVMVAAGVAALLGDSLVSLSLFGHWLAHFFIFYAVAVAYGPALIRCAVSPLAGVGAALVFFPLFWAAVRSGFDPWSLSATGPAIAGTTATVAAAQALHTSKLLLFLGHRSMPIYVTHIFFITATRIALSKLLGVTELVVLVPMCLAVGFCGPVVLLRVAGRLQIVTIMGFGHPVLE